MSYFGGISVRDGRVRRLPVDDFKSLVENYFHLPVTLPLRRSDFLALPKQERNRIKDVSFITPCTFTEEDTLRCDANSDKVVLACLDLDTPEDGSTYIADFDGNPDTLADALHPLNFVAYRTASSTLDNPRLRIVVDLVPSEPAMLRRTVSHIARLLGLPARFTGHRESTVISQPAYRPVMFQGETVAPVLCCRTMGQPLDPAALPEEDEPDHRTYAWRSDDVDCGLDQLPLQDLTVEDIREPLSTIDPDCGYEQWTHIAAALRHQFRDEADAAEAYQLFDEWSSTGAKYRGEQETYAKWRSFKPDSMGKKAVTIRSLFHYATETGWRSSKIAEKVQLTFDQWLAETDDVNLLMEEGCERIMAMPFRSELIEESMVIKLQKRIKAAGGVSLSTAQIRKQLGKVKFKEKEKQDDGNRPDWLVPWVYCGPLDKFIHSGQGLATALVPAAFNRSFEVHLMTPESQQVGKAPIMPSDFALNLKHLPRVDGLTYDPRHSGSDNIFIHEGLRYLNEYRPESAPLPSSAKADTVGGLLINHLRILIEEPEYADLILYFLAHIIQRPGVKIRWCPVIQSGEGAGKSILADLMGAAIGKTNVKIVSPNVMFAGPWNDWAFGCQFLVLEELRVQGKNRSDVMNRLKDFLTNNDLAKVEKYQNTRVCPNVANAIAFTNYHDAIHLDNSNRRYFVLESPLQSREQIEKLVESGHFDKLDTIIRKHGGALRHFLMNVRIPDDFPTDGPAPVTRYSKALIEASKNKLQVAIEQLIGTHPLIRPDAVDYEFLAAKVEPYTRNNHPVSHYLAILGYQNAGVHLSAGRLTPIWTHRQRFDDDLVPASEIFSEISLDAADLPL